MFCLICSFVWFSLLSLLVRDFNIFAAYQTQTTIWNISFPVWFSHGFSNISFFQSPKCHTQLSLGFTSSHVWSPLSAFAHPFSHSPWVLLQPPLKIQAVKESWSSSNQLNFAKTPVSLHLLTYIHYDFHCAPKLPGVCFSVCDWQRWDLITFSSWKWEERLIWSHCAPQINRSFLTLWQR